MMKYIPQAAEDTTELLKSLGLSSIEDLFSEIPSKLRMESNLDYPSAHSEQELRNRFNEISKNFPKPSSSFAGCGIYPHDVPSIVSFIQSRSEFATAYTPYQPEISQGLLQCIFEYQSLACQLTEMELSNASLYDGATSLGEAALMAFRIRKKSTGKVLICGHLHPHYYEVLQTYCEPFWDRFEVLEGKKDRIELGELEARLEKGDVEFLITQSPNFFGCIENYQGISKLVQKHNLFWMTSTMEALSWGLTRGPGFYGAHVATAEGQSFGNHAYLGGSTYGIFCTRDEYLRNLPGRLVGESTDSEGRRAFTLTFATREQFIRRGKATSNICTNNNLNMLAGLIHLCVLGKAGIRELAQNNFSKTQYCKSLLEKIPNIEVSRSPHFNEFCVDLKNKEAAELVNHAADQSWACGVDLGRFKKEWKHKLLIHTSELHSKQQIDQLAEFLKTETA